MKKSRQTTLENVPRNLEKKDIQCPICWSVLIEPVTFPCAHNVCLACYHHHIQHTSLNCPCCRLRLSVWSRKASNENKLVNEILWEEIKTKFENLVERRLSGQSSQEDFVNPERQEMKRDAEMVTKNGQLLQEFEKILKPHLLDIENEKKKEAKASFEFIKQIQEEEQRELKEEQARMKGDFKMAMKLQKQENFSPRALRIKEVNFHFPRSPPKTRVSTSHSQLKLPRRTLSPDIRIVKYKSFGRKRLQTLPNLSFASSKSRRYIKRNQFKLTSSGNEVEGAKEGEIHNDPKTNKTFPAKKILQEQEGNSPRPGTSRQMILQGEFQEERLDLQKLSQDRRDWEMAKELHYSLNGKTKHHSLNWNFLKSPLSHKKRKRYETRSFKSAK